MTSPEESEIGNLRRGIRAIELNVDALEMRGHTPKPREKRALESIKAWCRALLTGQPFDETCLIWSNEHRRWWAPGEAGYVTKLADAGRYSLKHAMQIVDRAQDGRMNMRDQVPPEIVVRETDALATLRW